MVHAQLNHGNFMVAAQTQHGQRHADVIVEVALRRQEGLRLEGAQDGGDHLRHRGLAIAAGHRDHGELELRTPVGGQRGQRQFGVRHHQAGQARGAQALIGIALADRRDSTLGLGLGQKIIGIKTLTPQRHKQVAGFDRAGVGVHAPERHRAAVHAACHATAHQARAAQPG